jgi:hypothetical protein
LLPIASELSSAAGTHSSSDVRDGFAIARASSAV